MKTTTRQLTLCAMLTALALALSWVERFLPLSLLIPLPGIKLGLANIVTLFALYALGPAQALLILLCRCTLGALFAGNLNALIYSLFGGVAAMLTMILLQKGKRLSVYGVSLGGAAAPWNYLPVLLGVSLISGTLTGFLSSLLFRAMAHVDPTSK